MMMRVEVGGWFKLYKFLIISYYIAWLVDEGEVRKNRFLFRAA